MPLEKYTNLGLQYINGSWREGGSKGKITSINPFSEEEYISFQAASMADVNEAFESAKEAQKEWSKTSPFEKNKIMQKAATLLEERKEEIINILIQDSGSTRIKAEMEVGITVQIIRLAERMPFKMETIVNESMIPGKKNNMIRKPLGVVGVIAPFNYPLYLAMRSVAPALATGNAVVLKAPSKDPIAGGAFIAKLFEEAGLPEGVLNYVVPKSSEIEDGFYAHPIPALISFTGSTAVGQDIGKAAGEKVSEVILELGGNNPMLVLEDADIDHAVRGAVYGSFFHSGQICMAMNRIIVHESVKEEFTSKFVEAAKKVKTGDPSKEDTVIGPLITSREADRVEEAIQKAKAEGAKVLLEGTREGNVLTPTIILGDNDTYTAKEEIFGPVITIIPAKDEEEAIRLANDVEEGLSSSVYTTDIARAHEVANQIEAGMTHINDQSINDEPFIAFGGEKKSGIGRFGREHSLDAFTTWKWVSVQEEPRKFPTDA